MNRNIGKYVVGVGAITCFVFGMAKLYQYFLNSSTPKNGDND
jgi:hypothetical protein